MSQLSLFVPQNSLVPCCCHHPRHQDCGFFFFPSVHDPLSYKIQFSGWGDEKGKEKPWLQGSLCCFQCCKVSGFADGVKGWETGMWVPQWLMKRVPGSTAAASARLLVVVGAAIARRPELAALPPLLTPCYLGLQFQLLLQQEEEEQRHCLSYFFVSTSSMCSRPSTLTDSEVWNSPSLYVVQMHLSCTIQVLLVVD